MNLPYTFITPVLGVLLEIRSNASQAIDLAREAFGRWSTLPHYLVQPGPPARFDIVVEPRDGPPAPGETLLVTTDHDSYTGLAGNVLLTCRFSTRHATARVPPSLLHDGLDWYRWFVNGNALTAVTQRDRYPVHAAGLVCGGTALLVVGASGAGKSTLSYAAVRAGHRLLDEDTVFVAVEGGLRLWAHPARCSLAPETVRWFPELAALAPRRMPHGKVRLALDVDSLGQPPALTHAGPVCLVELGRHDGAPRFEAIDAGELMRRVIAQPEAGFDLMTAHAAPAMAALAAQPAYRVTAGPDPRETVPLLATLAAEAAKGG